MADSITISWPDCIITINSLISNIEALREYVELDGVDEDSLYEAEEELNDYTNLLGRLRDQYNRLPNKGELPESLVEKIHSLIG